MSNNTNLSPAQRAANFKAITRQNLQTMSPIAVSDGGMFDVVLPKARFLARVFLKVDMTYTVSSAPAADKLYGLFKNITLNLNTAFRPFTVSGKALNLYNSLFPNKGMAGLTKVSTSGATFYFEMPVALNATDPTGYVLLQNTETAVNLSAELDTVANALGSGFTNVSIKVTPMLETFTIPTTPEAYPSLNILKLVNSRQETLISSSENIIRMTTGVIYRKILMQFYNNSGALADLDDDAIIQIVFNQADTPYNITAGELKMWNYRAYGHELPTGCYVFDFSTADIAEHNGSRDLIDTERLTECWIKVNTNANTVKAVITSESLAQVTA